MSLEIEAVFRNRIYSRSLVLAAFNGLAAKVRRHLKRRAANRALAHLNKDELRDIGLVRTEFGYRKLHHDRLGAEFWNQDGR